MSLRLLPQLQVIQQCDCCHGHYAEHEEGCPRAGIAAFVQTLHGPYCPACPEGKLFPNMMDYLECDNKKCRAIFSRSELVAGYDPSKLKKFTVIDYEENSHFPILQLPRKGRGQFRHKVVYRNFRLSIRTCKAAMKAERKERRKN